MLVSGSLEKLFRDYPCVEFVGFLGVGGGVPYEPAVLALVNPVDVGDGARAVL